MITRIKVCGITNLADAQAAVDCGADCLGFILVPESPRYVSPATAQAIIAGLAATVLKVGVFVNRSAVEIKAIMAATGLDIAQLHGEESAETAQQIGTERVWKAWHLRNPQDIEAAAIFPAAAILADTMLPGQRGGTGMTGDWALATALALRCRLVLAGGLTPDNIAEAIRCVKPWAVDVGSGVEIERGRKDHRKMADFIRRVREQNSAEFAKVR